MQGLSKLCILFLIVFVGAEKEHHGSSAVQTARFRGGRKLGGRSSPQKEVEHAQAKAEADYVADDAPPKSAKDNAPPTYDADADFLKDGTEMALEKQQKKQAKMSEDDDDFAKDDDDSLTKLTKAAHKNKQASPAASSQDGTKTSQAVHKNSKEVYVDPDQDYVNDGAQLLHTQPSIKVVDPDADFLRDDGAPPTTTTTALAPRPIAKEVKWSDSDEDYVKDDGPPVKKAPLSAKPAQRSSWEEDYVRDDKYDDGIFAAQMEVNRLRALVRRQTYVVALAKSKMDESGKRASELKTLYGEPQGQAEAPQPLGKPFGAADPPQREENEPLGKPFGADVSPQREENEALLEIARKKAAELKQQVEDDQKKLKRAKLNLERAQFGQPEEEGPIKVFGKDSAIITDEKDTKVDSVVVESLIQKHRHSAKGQHSARITKDVVR
eukprot:TRINITY_DN11050_c0_g1_i1.p1 TRINITY_DN11050_c0_g1~~TRINITY_DN11050_c0_g1_i1.p1  ORF type:complete len:438 (+),score=125.96 TRINITY_DN11050_c0_g1_i1:66-1379(+)